MATQPITTTENATGERNLITFRLGEQIYGLPIDPVERIIPMVTITPIPQVDIAVEGVINVRGRAVPVVNLRRHLGVDEIPLQQHTPILLVWIDGLLVGLIVDTVLDMLTLASQQIAQPADILPAGLDAPPILQGVVHRDRSAVLILDADHLFLPEQKEALRQAIASIEMQIEEMSREDDSAGEEIIEEEPEVEEPGEGDISEEEPNENGEIKP